MDGHYIDHPVRAAAILNDRRGAADEFLAGIVERQLAVGRVVRGCVMRRGDPTSTAEPSMWLHDVAGGREYLVSQNLGPLSTACKADLGGFARASEVFREALDSGADLVVSNRFGELESRGSGFAAELLELMSRDVPLLTTVTELCLPAWRAFTGGAPLLPADPAAVQRWLDRVAYAGRAAPSTVVGT